MLVNRKGITPLMGTLLLISFAVAIGVVVMNFGQAQVEEEAECAIDIGLKFAVIGGEDQVCYDGNTVRFTLENGPNIMVEGLVVNIIGEAKAESYEVNDAKILKAGTYLGEVSTTVGTVIRQVKISPKVVLYDAEQICTEQALVAENIRGC